jgi:hypothetical protein
MTARIVHLAHGKVTDKGPGVIVGPAVTFTIELRNRGDAPVDVNTVQVTATYGTNKTPAVMTNQASTKPFTGTLAAGASERGTYAFAIPTAGQGHVTVTVWYAQGKPTVAFVGNAR